MRSITDGAVSILGATEAATEYEVETCGATYSSDDLALNVDCLGIELRITIYSLFTFSQAQISQSSSGSFEVAGRVARGNWG